MEAVMITNSKAKSSVPLILVTIFTSMYSAICNGQGAPSTSQVGPGTPAPQQASPISVPLGDFRQYEQFLMEQSALVANLSKQQSEIYSHELIAITGMTERQLEFLKNEGESFRSFILLVVSGGIAGIVLIAGGFSGFLGWKTAEGIRNTISNFELKTQEIISQAASDLKNHMDKVTYEAKRQSQRAIIELSTGKDEAMFNSRVREKRIIWVDDEHDKFNEYLIDLLRSRVSILDIPKTTEDARKLLKERTYDVIITDTTRDGDEDAVTALFNQLPPNNQNAKKIINTGDEGMDKYKGSTGIDAIVVTDIALLQQLM
jgi:hypothetical protein